MKLDQINLGGFTSNLNVTFLQHLKNTFCKIKVKFYYNVAFSRVDVNCGHPKKIKNCN